MAERLLSTRLDAASPGAFDVSSAGVIGMVGRPMEPRAAEQLVRLGGDPAGFVARRLEPAHVKDADLVLTATLDVRRQVLEGAPAALRRTFTLREFAALCAVLEPESHGSAADLVASAAARRAAVSHGDLDVPDPMGRSERTHARVADLIDEAVVPIVQALVALGTGDAEAVASNG